MPYKRFSKKSSGKVNPNWSKKVRAVVKRQLNRAIEQKHVSYTQAATPTTSGVVTKLFQINQGVGEDERVGNAVRLKKLHVRSIYYNSASATNSTLVRSIYFMDKRQDYATAPTVTMVLESASMNANYAINYNKRFKILSDRTTALHPNFSGQIIEKQVNMTLNLRDAEQLYDDATTSLTKNGIYRLTISNQATNIPNLVGFTMLKYSDA